jgi:antirestriction protein ArdC
VPWVQPWGTAAAKAPLAMPKNASTGRFYSGINVLILWGSVIEHRFPVHGWLTFRQALGLGGNVRNGEHGTTVVYADRFIPDDEKKRAQETGRKRKRFPSSSASPSSTWRNAKVCRRISWSPHRHPSRASSSPRWRR